MRPNKLAVAACAGTALVLATIVVSVASASTTVHPRAASAVSATAATDGDKVQSGDQTTPDTATVAAAVSAAVSTATTTDGDNVQQGDQTTPDTSAAAAETATSETSSETSSETGTSDGPGGYADPAGANVQHVGGANEK